MSENTILLSAACYLALLRMMELGVVQARKGQIFLVIGRFGLEEFTLDEDINEGIPGNQVPDVIHFNRVRRQETVGADVCQCGLLNCGNVFATGEV